MTTAVPEKATLTAAIRGDGSGIYQTSPGLLRRRALGPWAEGLAQYLAIRIGDARRGQAAFRSLSRMIGSLPPNELVRPPGPKAQLYRLARSIAETERAMPGLRSSHDLEFRRADARAIRQRAERIRDGLSRDDAELLELRHARELDVEEIACVLEVEVDEVELMLDTAEARARQLLGRDAPDPVQARATVYVEAFALAPSWRDEYESLDDEVEVPALPAGTLIGGRYQLTEQVGTGAFGDVYRAEDVEVPGHQVALKLLRQPSLSESARRSALRELKLNAAVFHPSLVQFKDHGWYEQRLWFVMPWYDGETLDARIRRGALSRKEARAIFEPLTRALAALHAAGIRHQDIKPENILLTELPEGTLPVLIDLGVAAEEQETLLGGTPLYFAPEVALRFVEKRFVRGPEVTASADVFALALSLRNALEPDTQEDVAAGAVQAFVARRATQDPSLPEGRDLRYLKRHFERWLSHEPTDRPTAREFAEELVVLTLPEERRARRIRLLRWMVPLATVLATAFALVIAFYDQRTTLFAERARVAYTEARDAQANLQVAGVRQRELEAGQAALLDRFEQSRLSRRELAEQLAAADTDRSALRSSLETRTEALTQVSETLDETRTSLTDRTGERDEARELAERERLRGDREQARADQRTEELASAERVAERTRADLTDARTRADALSAMLASTEAQERAARSRAETAERTVDTANAARRAAEQELARLTDQIRQLTQALEASPEEAPLDTERVAPNGS